MKNLYFLLASMLVFLASCGGSDNAVEYVPFQEEEDGRWGLVSIDGEVLFSEEFKHQPTVVTNGRFFVMNDEDRWELYAAEKMPRQIGGEYVSVGMFSDGVAPVVEKGKCVTFIDTEGKVKLTLDKLDGKPVDAVRSFKEKRAVFSSGSLYGAIDMDGKVVVKPEYSSLLDCKDGKFIGMYTKPSRNDAEYGDVKLRVLDKDGKTLFEFDGKDYEMTGYVYGFVDGKMPVKVTKNGESRCGIVDEKGKWVMEPNERVSEIRELRGDCFIYEAGDGCGLMNLKGEVLIRPKYDNLFFLADDRVQAMRVGDEETTVLDLEGNVISEDDYEDVMVYFSNGVALARESSHSWVFVDKDCKPVNNNSFEYVSIYSYANEEVMSDYVDIDALLNEVKIAKNSIGGVTFSITPEKAVARFIGSGADPEYYTYDTYVSKSDYWSGCSIEYGVGFYENIGETDDGVNYRYSNAKPEVIYVTFYNSDRLFGKMQEFKTKVFARLSKLGRKVKSNDNAIVLDIGNDRCLRSFYDGGELRVQLVDLDGYDINDISIEDYETIEENDEASGDADYGMDEEDYDVME